MTPNRRTLLAATAGLLAGCTGLESGSTPTEPSDTWTPEPTDTGESTPTPSEEWRLADLRIGNRGEEARTPTVRFVPDSGSEATLAVSVLVPSDEGVLWENIPALDEEGQVMASVETGDGETLEDELDWHGDTIEDNRGIEVSFDDEELAVRRRVA
jgi:hypothetical protein